VNWIWTLVAVLHIIGSKQFYFGWICNFVHNKLYDKIQQTQWVFPNRNNTAHWGFPQRRWFHRRKHRLADCILYYYPRTRYEDGRWGNHFLSVLGLRRMLTRPSLITIYFADRNDDVSGTLDHQSNEPRFESRAIKSNLGQFRHTTLLWFTQLYEWVAAYKQWSPILYEYYSFNSCSLPGCFPWTLRLCSIERTCQGGKCKALWTIIKTDYYNMSKCKLFTMPSFENQNIRPPLNITITHYSSGHLRVASYTLYINIFTRQICSWQLMPDNTTSVRRLCRNFIVAN